MSALLIFLLLGGFAGLLAGLLGVGGGLVIVPVLAMVLAGQGVEPALIMHIALGTSLATIVFTSLSSVRAHHRRGAVQWAVFRQLTPGIVVGALLGAAIADALPTEALRLVFGLFALAVAAQIGLGAKPAPHRHLPGRPGMATAGGVIGAVSAIVGIGGGSLTVPFLIWCNVAVRQAVATSAACGLPIALAGAVGYGFMGSDEAARPAWSVGYIYVPALLAIAAASVATAPLGARLAHSASPKALQRFFALFLAGLGVWMVLG